ncbi:3-dehydroquinate synthase [Paludicola sp. MB14-C6]|uniref:3-dehydroquinate synthase n=1 Tax=Paludihabitans sp. MB14-C6 TaxID=3070656 RepID=UPI0027DE7AE4|nr:3-dehydroquinate synthase [Paludicola sp. MB14-C6]WMJ22520.1 3-dehydroquinate synthase [Paludicola sp. MB14-C6]
MKLTVELKDTQYDIIIERGVLSRISDYVNLNRKVLVITDDGVPKEYLQTVLSQCKEGYSQVVMQGEGAKSFPVYEQLCRVLLNNNFTRKDLVIALGGGVIGDLSGFVASTYMRGIDFVNIPTTTLSQIDSSVGGKVAINLDHVKNIIGCFYQPKMVFVDSDTLNTLPNRHYVNGLVEAIKSGLIYDKDLFELFERENIKEHIDEIIFHSLSAKKDVVEKDEKEENLRKILNFGHTIGHAIESINIDSMLHGECVAIGMLPMIEDEALKQRVINVYQKLGLKQTVAYDKQQVIDLIHKDKKAYGSKITIIKVKELGKADLEDINANDLFAYL